MTETKITIDDPAVLYENLEWEPAVGQVWLFNDEETEKAHIEWRITEVLGDDAVVVKLTGEDKGYTGRVSPITEFKTNSRWSMKEGVTASGRILFNCPNCEEPRPIRMGDYICEACRGIDS